MELVVHSRTIKVIFFSIKSIINATQIPCNHAPQIRTNKETRDPIKGHHDSLCEKKYFLSPQQTFIFNYSLLILNER